MSAGKKILVGGISAVLLVAAVIGVVATFAKSKSHSVGDDFQMPTNADGLTSTSKSVKFFCQPTDFKEACEQSLNAVLGSNKTVPLKDIVAAAVTVTVDAVKSAHDKTTEIGKIASDEMNRGAVSDCKKLLQYAVEELQDASAVIGQEDALHKLPSRVDDIKTWLSAVVAYQETCLDQITQPELKSAMQNGLLNSSQFTSNALAIFNQFAGYIRNFQNLTIPGTQRRLLAHEDGEVYDRDTQGYPTWLSAGDRRLLAARGRSRVRPNVVVAQDGSGNYRTIGEAMSGVPRNSGRRYVIYVKAGIYREYVTVEKNMLNVFMYGDGPRRTIVTGKKCNRDGYRTMESATFAVEGDGFLAKSMGFTNTAGPDGHQAVALRVMSDRTAFFNCRMDGYQDTLYQQTHRQFYRNCVVSGTVDFIFGDGSVVMQNCLIIVRRPMDNQQNTVTAHGKKFRTENTGLVIHNCRIVPEKRLFPDRFRIPSYLGRPWKEFSTTIIMESTIGDLIRPEGWMPWDGDLYLNTLFYGEYRNRGPGARTNRRVRWRGFKVITSRREAMQFTAGPFIQLNRWLSPSDGKYLLGLRY